MESTNGTEKFVHFSLPDSNLSYKYILTYLDTESAWKLFFINFFLRIFLSTWRRRHDTDNKTYYHENFFNQGKIYAGTQEY